MKNRWIIGRFLPALVALSVLFGAAVTANADPSGRFLSAWVSVEENLTLHVTAETDASVTAPKAHFTGASRDVTVDGVKDGENWRFDFEGIYSQCMADNISMQLLDGETVLSQGTFSIRGYFNTLYASTASELKINNEKFAALKTLMADILEFGAAAQAYSGYNVSDPANNPAWVASEKTQSFVKPESDMEVVKRGNADRITAASLVISNDISLCFKAKAASADRITVAFEGATPETYMLSAPDTDGVCKVLTEGLMATAYGRVCTVTLTDASETVYSQIKYSVNSYVASAAESEDAQLAGIVRVLYAYGVSAQAYAQIDGEVTELTVDVETDADEPWGPLM